MFCVCAALIFFLQDVSLLLCQALGVDVIAVAFGLMIDFLSDQKNIVIHLAPNIHFKKRRINMKGQSLFSHCFGCYHNPWWQPIFPILRKQ